MQYVNGLPYFPQAIETEVSINGKYLGKDARVYHVLGRRSGFTSTSVLNDIKEFDNSTANILELTGTEALEIVSTSANDSSAGSAARTVKVTYISDTGVLTESANISLAGLTPVASGFVAKAILWMEVTSSGGDSSTVAAGNIVLRTVTGSFGVEQISSGGNKSLSAKFMVPTDYSAFITRWSVSAVNADQDARLRATVNTTDRSISTVYHFVDSIYAPINSVTSEELPFLKFPSASRIKVSTLSAGTAGTVRCSTDITIIMIHD